MSEQEPPSSSDADARRLAAIVRSSNDAIIGKSAAGVVQSWNAAAERMFGYGADEMIGQSIRRLIPEDRQHEEDDILERILRGEEVKNFETIRLRRDGSEIRVSITISPILDGDGEVVGASKIARDITEQTAMVAKLRESEERFRTLADNICQFTWMADKDGYIFWYNKRWYDYTGRSFDDMKGWGWRDVHHPDHVDRVVAGIQRSWETGEPWEDTFPLLGADGNYRWFLSRALPIRDENGDIVRWFGSNTDVTEQRRREEQIVLLMREINHRAKNLLGLTQAIARQSADDPNSEFVQRFCARLQALSANQDVLINSGWLGGDLETLVRGQLGHFADAIGKRILLSGPSVMLPSTAAQPVGMAMHELATNAGKYGALSNEDGRVHISWSVVGDGGTERRFEIEWVESGGPPVSPPKRKGFGSMVVGEMLRKSLDAEVEFEFPPEGLRWRLSFADRRAQPEADGAAAESADGEAGFRRKCVLVVEDDAIIALDLAENLKEAGYSVIGPASRVDEALQLLREHRCDIAVLDIHLGGETSSPIAAALQKSRTPYITLSGYAADQRDASLGEATHLTKPFRPEALLASLASQLQVEDCR